MTENYDYLLENCPDGLAESLAARQHWRQATATGSSDLEFIVSDIDRWKPGSTVTVAFSGGSTELHGTIAEACAVISEACGLVLDFGGPTGAAECAGGYRTWSTDDIDYTADIRVGFDKNGYWSLVGTASVDPSIGHPSHEVGGRPYQQTMNFGGFDERLPPTWRRTVLHEFLHALAFKHEHQNMRGPCQDQFRWEDDELYVPTTDGSGRFAADPHGRRPGIYTYLGGPPNNWSRAKVDHNLRSDGAEDGVASSFDPESVMLYRFPPLFYESNPSPCAPVGEGNSLSDGDRRGLQLLYPDIEGGGTTMVDRAKSAQGELAQMSSSDEEGLESLGPDFHAGTLAMLERLWS